ncbi:Glycosyltransferase involved in cell wall bisynthesis [Gilliamella bombicola]|uniref:Glycosyltransferase involved in cell wall bisynthesis n=1 Tax=Gilliamella bombicola TaxID=1798182 RepID=A0A1C4ASJ5_9GAMM|nr:glycosyltransferase [Gilliamella bombicola]SCB97539.1 Glycosyltransferase involved in cell wall bisynthesis [Gilliamella bombicola]
MLPKVSIVVPVYNVEKYLRQCLDSIINQTLTNIEIICVNDGSTDNSLTILQEYADKDSRIRVIDKPNSGYGHSMNIGFQLCTGEYIGIVESDDFAKSEMFEILYKIAIENDLDIARCHFFTFTQKDSSIKKIDSYQMETNVLINPQNDLSPFLQWPSVWANIYKRTFIQKNNLKFLETPGASYQDTAFSFKVYACATRMMLIDAPLIYYRIHDQSSIKSKDKVFCICDEFNEIMAFCKNKMLYEKLKYLICYLQYKSYKWNYNRLEMPHRYLFLLHWSKEIRKNSEIYSRNNPFFIFKDLKKIVVIKLLPLLYRYRNEL